MLKKLNLRFQNFRESELKLYSKQKGRAKVFEDKFMKAFDLKCLAVEVRCLTCVHIVNM